MKERQNILLKAGKKVVESGIEEYGQPENNFGLIAALWSDYLQEVKVTAEDVAAMMILLKIARVKTGNDTVDSYVDIAGYAACGGEIATNKEKENDR